MTAAFAVSPKRALKCAVDIRRTGGQDFANSAASTAGAGVPLFLQPKLNGDGPPQATSVTPTSLDSDLLAGLGSGEPLALKHRAPIEAGFGQDFQRVRIHTDATGAAIARDINARAFTFGSDIVFAPGEFAPDAKAGSFLLAHELAHVVQQRSATKAPGALSIGALGDAQERDADVAAQRVSEGDAAAVTTTSPAVVRRAPGDTSAAGLAGQKSWWDNLKGASYRQVIEGLRASQKVMLQPLRSLAAMMPVSIQPVATSFVDFIEFVSDLEVSFLLGLVGLLVGLGHGIVAAIVGLIKLAGGIVEWLIRWVMSFFSDKLREEYQDWVGEVWEAFKRIPDGLGAAFEKKKREFASASPDQMSLLIGELTGEVIAILATIEVGGGVAGSVPKLTVTLGGGELALAFAGGSAPALAGATTVAVDVASPATALALTATQMTRVSDSGGNNPKESAKTEPPKTEKTEPKKSEPPHKQQPKKVGGKRVYPQKIENYIAELKKRFPKLENAGLRPKQRGAGPGMFEERMRTGGGEFSFRGKLRGWSFEVDDIGLDGTVTDIKIREGADLPEMRTSDPAFEEEWPEFTTSEDVEHLDIASDAAKRDLEIQMEKQSELVKEFGLIRGIWQTNRRELFDILAQIRVKLGIKNIDPVLIE